MTTSKTLNLVSFQNKVATEPFKNIGPTQKETGKGFVVIEQKHSLTALKVVFNTSDLLNIEAGDEVYVLADSYLTVWGKMVYTVEGQDFILIPKESIVVLNRIKSDSWGFGD
jgi:hypothetical protein